MRLRYMTKEITRGYMSFGILKDPNGVSIFFWKYGWRFE